MSINNNVSMPTTPSPVNSPSILTCTRRQSESQGDRRLRWSNRHPSRGQNSEAELSWMLASKLIASGFMHPMTSTTQLPSSKVASASKLLASGWCSREPRWSARRSRTLILGQRQIECSDVPRGEDVNWNWPARWGCPPNLRSIVLHRGKNRGCLSHRCCTPHPS